MNKSRVIIKKSSYDYSELKPVIFSIMDSLCPNMIRPGSWVVLKPNLLAPALPDKAIVTHPLVVKSIAEYALNKGAKVQISDSQAMGTFEKVLKESGLREELKGLDVEFKEFKQSVKIDVGGPFKAIEIAEDAINADVLINLPKLKTHVQMLMTLGVKNLFGCIVGMKKPEWHFRTGVNREMFAELLIRIHNAVNPSITILDGILAMEGEGPGRSGVPREAGVVAGSSNAIALDITICRLLGLDSFGVLTNKAAKALGHVPDDIEVQGEMPVIKDFKFPGITPLVFGPKKLHGLMRRHLVQRPVAGDAACRLCGECWKYCPAKAISAGKKSVHFDYEKCIRCYCCIEVCPHGALKTAEPFAGRIIRKIKG